MMLVRPAIENDLREIVDMAAAAVPETFPHLTFSAIRVRASFRRALEQQNPAYFVVEAPGRRLVGFQIVSWGSSDFSTALIAEQKVIYVRPENRRSSAAALLVRNLMAWSARLGVDELYVNVGSGRRTKATARFIRGFGFENVGSVLRKVGP